MKFCTWGSRLRTARPSTNERYHFHAAADFHPSRSQGEREDPGALCGGEDVSRSATLVLAYLMIYQRMTLVEAINTVKEKRGIIPNRGFLRQLLDLESKLRPNH
ncbi:unnamed protein product [Staurois parvus]|uniref:Dual specificity phosphatase catalytic domain-containing protein n=1 Tax=Staurois parvus TaxID=386267 RepID=A0ABN9HC89_9NEOB|nr:unnamed protein product [Staurois parvus]